MTTTEQITPEPETTAVEPTEATAGTRVTRDEPQIEGDRDGANPVAEEPVPGHKISVLDSTGDTKLIWDPENADEVAAAANLFAELKTKGFLTYKVDKDGNQAEVVHKFDPQATAIIASPQPVGG